MSHAVVIVSGGDAISPFTTPDAACRTGQAAGSTDTGLRAALLAAGFGVYTSPATVGPGIADTDPGFAGFAYPPALLPPGLTVDAVGPIDTAGAHLAAFLSWLAESEVIDEVSLVGHSMGGLFSRAAIRELAGGPGPTVRLLVTVGTPWEGSFAADVAIGDLDPSAAGSDAGTGTVLTEYTAPAQAASRGAGEQVTHRYLAGPDGWNARQVGVLDGIPVTLIAGDHYRLPGGDSRVWPHEGLVTASSALAASTPDTVLPHAIRHAFADVHSIYFADQFDLPWERALTWDPRVMDVVIAALGRREPA